MWWYLLILLPAVAAIVWAVAVKVRLGAWRDVVDMLICAVAALVNAYLVCYTFQSDGLPACGLVIRQLLSAIILPVAYLFFARQLSMGKWDTVITTLLWSALLLFILPGGVVYLDDTPLNNVVVCRWAYHCAYRGHILFHCETADIVLCVQTWFVVISYIDIARILRKYGMRASGKLRYFMVWCTVMVLFIFSCALSDILYAGGREWLFFTLYSLLLTSIYGLLAQNFDLRPYLQKMVEEEDNVKEYTVQIGQPVDAEKMIIQTQCLAEQVRSLLNQDQVWLQPGYSSKDAIAALGTNRTYFARMMMTEFGCRFGDLVLKMRMDEARRLLRTTDMTITEVADQSGFGDSGNMTVRFKEIEHMTPAKWRQKAKRE
ncbi:MAG: helix-turn-helix domain-containing protein [Paludibacteraceae bacterium]